MAKKKTNRRGHKDHTADPRGNRRMRISKDLNILYDSEYDSQKILLPEDVLDQFKEFYIRFRGNNPTPN